MPGDSEDAISGWTIVSCSERQIANTIKDSMDPLSSGWRIVSTHGDETTPLYEGMHRLICKLAWQYTRRCMLDVEDLINEGYLALLRVRDKYDPSRASRSTFVYWVVRNHFCGLARRWPIQPELPQHLSHDPSQLFDDAHIFRTTIHSLSTEAKEVIKLILQCPEEICEMAKTGTPLRLRWALTKILTSRKGWRKDSIATILSEISNALNYNR